MNEDFRHLEFLALNSKEIVEKQVDSYRQQHSYAGTIIGVSVLFIPFFLNGLDGTSQVIQFIAIFPVAFFIVAILLLLSLFKSKPLDQAFAVLKYKELLIKPYREILLYEIDANASSYAKNIQVTEKANKRYTNGVQLTTIAILVSITLLLANKFIAIEQVPAKVQVVSINKLKPDKIKRADVTPIKKFPIQKH
jgi:glucan phosphoethanolaminetransferase (alkaline phosphatase superfamily)